ncbi:hypothetical protein POM88_012683 [Heracleum sosnowskyi]|uniref:Uncharacterized protein n=1 Tax=Heracleum sosnowskyi TaxID=360622 RepID=A0AAD8J0D1_9APIA|nr:hypothetical protein POM88_012683 [Heracleum sosnowskyi]
MKLGLSSSVIKFLMADGLFVPIFSMSKTLNTGSLFYATLNAIAYFYMTCKDTLESLLLKKVRFLAVQNVRHQVERSQFWRRRFIFSSWKFSLQLDFRRTFDGVLQSNFALKTLDLFGNPIGDEGAKGFSGLANALLESKTINAMYLNGNYGGALGAAALAKGLEGNKSLKELYVNGNSVGDEGVRALVSGLVLHKGKLTILDIGNNAISSKGAHHVAEFIKGSKTLTWISIYMNDIGDEILDKEAVEEVRAQREIPDIKPGYII